MRRARRHRLALSILGAALLLPLAACSGKKEGRACPRIEIVDDLSRLVKFADGPGREPADVLYAARIGDAKSQCTYDKAGVTVDMTVTIRGERGRAGARLPGGDVTYFVAITDGKRNIVAKQDFTSRLAFGDKGQAQLDDELQQRIPLKPIGASLNPLPSAADHTIILGFQLTPDQIDFNEKQHRN
ncbi:MAG: hypothetical protein JO010_00465 [Alphaproteobacteria bacterium]|nr:hypothetical protein [Alphaproteobacteria bacterium]